MKYFFYMFWLLFVVLVIVFVSVNSQEVTLHYYISDLHIILPLLMLIVLFIGFIAFFCAFFPLWVRMKSCNRQLAKKIKALECELNNLRTLPVKGHLQ
jgi:uncharacterized membrane protein YciS (DUF1049 family)